MATSTNPVATEFKVRETIVNPDGTCRAILNMGKIAIMSGTGTQEQIDQVLKEREFETDIVDGMIKVPIHKVRLANPNGLSQEDLEKDRLENGTEIEKKIVTEIQEHRRKEKLVIKVPPLKILKPDEKPEEGMFTISLEEKDEEVIKRVKEAVKKEDINELLEEFIGKDLPVWKLHKTPPQKQKPNDKPEKYTRLPNGELTVTEEYARECLDTVRRPRRQRRR